MFGLLKRAMLVLAVAPLPGLPLAAEAQNSVNPNLPMTTKPRGPANPAFVTPGNPVLQKNRTGVIAPPQVDSRMPVIHPRILSRMPVIPPAGTPGGNTTVIPK